MRENLDMILIYAAGEIDMRSFKNTLVCIGILAATFGCGIKGPPMPPQTEEAEQRVNSSSPISSDQTKANKTK